MKHDKILNYFIILFILLIPLVLHHNLMTEGVLSTVDTPQAYFPVRWLVYKSLSGGNFPWWNQYMAGGMSLIAYPDATALYFPAYFLFFVFKPVLAFNVSFMLHYGLAGVFVFLMLMRMKLRRPAAILGALAFMFSGFFIGHRVHSVMVETAVWLPGIIWAVLAWFDSRKMRWLFLMTTFVILQIFAGYMQVVLMTWFICGMIITYFLIFNLKKWYLSVFVVCALAAGVLIAGFHLLNISELANLSLRSKIPYEQFTAGSFNLKLLWQFIFPFFCGTQWHSSAYAHVPFYHGVSNFSEMAAYCGAFIIISALISIFNKNHFKICCLFFIIAAIAFIWMLGNNTPVAHFMFLVPLFNKFRVPARYLFIFIFSVTVLGAIGIDAIINFKNKISYRIAAFITYVLIILTIILLVWFGKIPTVSWQLQWVKFPLLFAGGIALSTGFSFIPKIGKFLVYAIVIFAVADMSMFAYNNNMSNVVNNLKEKNTMALAKDYYKLTKKDVVKPRVFNCFHNYWERNKGIGANKNVLMKIPTLDCYGPLFLKCLAWLGLDPSAFYHNPEKLIVDNDILSILNVKYIASLKSKHILSQKVKRRKIEKTTSVLLPDIDKWEKSNVDKQRCLCSSDGKKPAVVFTQARLKKNTAYKFRVTAYSKNADDALRIDLSAENYDSNDQEFEIKSYMLEKSPQVFEHIIETGNKIPDIVLVRIFTFSKKPIVVKNFSLEELTGEIIEKNVAENYKKTGAYLIENINNCGYAWFPDKLIAASGKWAALDYINNSPVAFNPKKEALVEECDLSGANPQTVKIIFTTNSPNSRLFVVDNFAEKPAFMVVSEMFFPGWQARIDGKLTKLFRVNGLISGLCVPTGKHTVTVKFRPTASYKGLLTFTIGLLLLIGLKIIHHRFAIYF